MEKKISIFEDVSKDIINKFFKKEEFKKDYFSFYFDEETNSNCLVSVLKKYPHFDDINLDIFYRISDMMMKQYDFTDDIIKRYVLIVKNIENHDIDILSLIFKSINLQFEIMKFKTISKTFETLTTLENFIIENFHYNIQDYINLLSKFYSNEDHKPLLINIFVMIYNYSLFYSIERLKKMTFIKKLNYQ